MSRKQSLNLGLELKNGLIWILKRTPLISGLVGKTTFNNLVEALKETSLVVFFAMTPILLNAIFKIAHTETTVEITNWPWFFAHVILNDLNQGETFIYAITLLAPAFFIIYKFNREDERFENILSFIWTFAVIILFGSAFFYLLRSGIVKNASVLSFIKGFSWVFCCVSIFIMYLASAYNGVLSQTKIRKMQQSITKGLTENRSKESNDLKAKMESYFSKHHE